MFGLQAGGGKIEGIKENTFAGKMVPVFFDRVKHLNYAKGIGSEH